MKFSALASLSTQSIDAKSRDQSQRVSYEKVWKLGALKALDARWSPWVQRRIISI
ncbi:hypothetical protein [Gimesia maris]|uniref:hypothetical protein n=1 Tax=Gimesia maris TaxID=122 RepID=UPI000303A57F|nr:hypothetical protein [Gimesia maris]